jgi:hypothetical protein
MEVRLDRITDRHLVRFRSSGRLVPFTRKVQKGGLWSPRENSGALGHPMTASPGMPPDRLKILRDAFAKTAKVSRTVRL